MTNDLRVLDSGMLARALALYLQFAYPGDLPLPRRARITIDDSLGLDRVLGDIERDPGCAVGRHVMRLGNHAYPHMKLAIERSSVDGHWYLAVDCHDGALGDCLAADRSAWEGVRLQNASIKAAIETAWGLEGIPTVRRHTTRMLEREHVRRPARKPGGSSTAISAVFPVTEDRPLVLVVDDEEEMAELFAIYLRQDGFRTAVVTDSSKAMAEARRLKPSLILLDYMMPEVSGQELCLSLKADTALAFVPRILCTYAAIGHDALACADEVIAKPVDRVTLVGRVRQHLARRLVAAR
jgi:CheY-like chemotaxis protein